MTKRWRRWTRSCPMMELHQELYSPQVGALDEGKGSLMLMIEAVCVESMVGQSGD